MQYLYKVQYFKGLVSYTINLNPQSATSCYDKKKCLYKMDHINYLLLT